MAATSRLGLNAQTPGTNAFTWGNVLNTQAIDLLDEAFGVETIPVAGSMTLTSTNFQSNQARNAALLFTAGGLVGASNITIPTREKVYLVLNSTGFALTFTAGGATATLATGRWGFIVCNGTDVLGFDPVAVTDAARIAAQAAQLAAETAATNAGSAASSAAGQASAASTARTGAQAAQAAAEAAYDSFDDRYLGAKSSAPTVDNDGNTLIVGAIYFDTTLAVMRVWTGSAWQAFIPAAADYLLKSGGTMTGLIGLVSGQYASQAEAQAGTDTSKLMTPQRTAQAIAGLTPAPTVPGLVFISQQTVSSAVASVVFTGLTSAYDDYVFVLDNIVPSVTASLNIRTSANNGSSFDAGSTDYAYVSHGINHNSQADSGGTNTATSIPIGTNQPSSSLSLGGISAEVRAIRPSSANEFTSFAVNGSAINGANVYSVFKEAAWRNAAAIVNAISFAFSTGNIASGTFKLYGLRKS